MERFPHRLRHDLLGSSFLTFVAQAASLRRSARLNTSNRYAIWQLALFGSIKKENKNGKANPSFLAGGMSDSFQFDKRDRLGSGRAYDGRFHRFQTPEPHG
jgi:hypothetical protein